MRKKLLTLLFFSFLFLFNIKVKAYSEVAECTNYDFIMDYDVVDNTLDPYLNDVLDNMEQIYDDNTQNYNTYQVFYTYNQDVNNVQTGYNGFNMIMNTSGSSIRRSSTADGQYNKIQYSIMSTTKYDFVYAYPYNDVANYPQNYTIYRNQTSRMGFFTARNDYISNSNFILLYYNNSQSLNKTGKKMCISYKGHYFEVPSSGANVDLVIPSYFDIKNSLSPEIKFTSNSYSSNNEVYKKDITINFDNIDNKKYSYFILDTRSNIWNEIQLTNTTSYTITARENYVIYAEIRDKSDNSVVTSASYAITDITSNISISFNEEKIVADNGQLVGSNIFIDYYTKDPSNYTYTYFIWYLEDENPLPTITTTLEQTKVRMNYDGVLYAEIRDNSDNSIVASASHTVQDNLSVPAINFYERPNWKYEQYNCELWGGDTYCGKQCIDKVELFIDYGFLDNDKYIYQYSFDGEDWTSVSLYCNDWYNDIESCARFKLNLSENKLVIARVLSSNDMHVVSMATHYVARIGVCSNDNSNSSIYNDPTTTLSDFSSFFNSFKDLFVYFFTKLNPAIRNVIIAIFTLLVMAGIIKIIRR